MTVSGGASEHRTRRGFSLIEMLVSMAVLSVLMVFLMEAMSTVTRVYIDTDSRTRSDEKGRAVIELISREVTPAAIDTRMQFIILPGEKLSDAGAVNVVETSPAMLWMAPLGPGGDLRCVGYFLTGSPDLKKYRLKRIFIKNDNPDGYFPKVGKVENAGDAGNRTSPTDASWFTDAWDEQAFDDASETNDKVIISTVSDGVVAFWIRALDSMGNPVPQLSSAKAHPKSDLFYNSAAYFYMADGESFDEGKTFVYLKKNRLTMKANRLPAAVELAIVMIDEDNINRGPVVPAQENVVDSETGELDMDSSINDYRERLKSAGFSGPRVFRTTVKITNGV